MSGLQKLEQRAKKCIELHGGILNKPRVCSLYLVSFLVGLRTYQHRVVYAMGWTMERSIPAKSEGCFSSPDLLNRLYDPRSFLFHGYRMLFD